MSPKREIGRFLVKTEGGKEYIIVQSQEYKVIYTGGGAPPNEVPGLMSFLTDKGLAVHYIDAATFKIGPTEEIVWKV